MSIEKRIEDLKEFSERHGFELLSSTDSQREPGWSFTLRDHLGVTVSADSTDSQGVALAKLELILIELARAHSDAYICEPDPQVGRLSS